MIKQDKKKLFTKVLRKEQTWTEQLVWQKLRNRKCLGLKFRRQHIIEGFIVDFFCEEYKLALEIDGEIHKKRKEYDDLRQQLLEAEDINLIRITNKQIENDENIIFNKINEFLGTPSPSGRGGQGVRAV